MLGNLSPATGTLGDISVDQACFLHFVKSDLTL